MLKFEDNDGKNIKITEQKEVRRVFSKATCSKVIEAMESVVMDNGTGVKAKVLGYRIAGKTGTAQKINPETGKYYANKYIASFIGVFPVSDPEFTIAVIVDDPEGLYWGSETGAPIFSKLAKDIILYYNIQPDFVEDKSDTKSVNKIMLD